MKLKDKLPQMAQTVIEYALSKGWELEEASIAGTGTCYVELFRRSKSKRVRGRPCGEWVTIRVADHKKVHTRFLKTYSISPSELSMGEVKEILSKRFGNVGDVFRGADHARKNTRKGRP